MSAQEAAYMCLSMKLSKFSRDNIFVNTSPIDERVRMLKTSKELEKMNPDDTNITVADIHEKYAKRDADYEDICLADYAAEFSERREDGRIFLIKREKARILRYTHYSEQKDAANYYREQCVLYLPWRNERSEIEVMDCKVLYQEHEESIKRRRQKYHAMSEEQAQRILDHIANAPKDDSDDEGENESQKQARKEQEQSVDLFEQAGKKADQETKARYLLPKKVQTDDMLKYLERLNEKQRILCMHIYKSLKTNQDEQCIIYLAGSAGVGKSCLINAINLLTTNHFDSLPGSNPETLKVLLTAFAGKAAFLIHGTTLHSAFALPVRKRSGKNPMGKLSDDLANTIRCALNDVKLLIIDEISMVSNTILNQVSTRLIQVKGCTLPFGGISVIVVGDLKQLPPVSGQSVFMPETESDTAIFSDLWGHFKYFELTEIMRQRDEKEFITALNNLADGKMTPNDIKLFESRVVNSVTDAPTEAIRLFHSNKNVSDYNNKRIAEHPGEEYSVIAEDSVGKNVPIRAKEQALRNLLKKTIYDQGNLPTDLRLKVGIKYMITCNLDIKDGLVNGACGTLRYIKFNNGTPEIVFIEFPPNVGAAAKSEINHIMANEKGFCNDWVPIKMVTNETFSDSPNVRIFRKQFPLVPAEAMTIHKSQGQTYEFVCVDLSTGGPTRQLWYVALSRVTKLNNLYIVRRFRPPNAPKADDPVQAELHELKTKKSLKICFNTLQLKTGTVVAYHNVRSFLKYNPQIQNDAWYSRCNILILAETQTISTDRPALQDFQLVHRFDDFRTRGPRGILVFSKPNMALKMVKAEISKSTDNQKSYQSTVFLFECKDFYLISGYRSPSTPAIAFEHQLTSIMSMAKSNSNKKIISMGDFNFDSTIANNPLNRIMLKFGMQSRLKSTDVTTNYNTQIDVVYTNFKNVTSGTYESYFSDHKPIFCMLNNKYQDTNSHTQPIKLLNIQVRLNRMKFPENSKPTNVKRSQRILSNNNEQQASSTPIIIDDDEPVAAVTLARAREASIAAELRNICSHIRRRGTYLEDTHIDNFISLVNRDERYNMITTLAAQRIEHYKRSSVEAMLDDVQIIFEGRAGPSNLGHYICIRYIADYRTIIVYDPLNSRNVSDRTRNILRTRFPGYNEQLEYAVPRTAQPDLISCGIFAVAYATTIILGEDPTVYPLLLGNSRQVDKTLQLRDHMAKMLEEGRLSLFPKPGTFTIAIEAYYFEY